MPDKYGYQLLQSIIKAFYFFEIQAEVTQFCIQCNCFKKKYNCQFSKTMTIDILPDFIKAVVFHHVTFSLMVETKEQYTFSVEENCVEWRTRVLWFNETIFWNPHGPIFEEFFVNAYQYGYDLMCDIHFKILCL